MRLRTVVTMSVGATVGAGAMYLLDPDHGLRRRRDARRRALRVAQSGAMRTLTDLRGRAVELAVAAAAGYQQARTTGTTERHIHLPSGAHLDGPGQMHVRDGPQTTRR